MRIHLDPAIKDHMTQTEVRDACYYHHGRGLAVGFLAGMATAGIFTLIIRLLG